MRLLRRALNPCMKWNADRQVELVPFANTGASQKCVALFQSGLTLHHALEAGLTADVLTVTGSIHDSDGIVRVKSSSIPPDDCRDAGSACQESTFDYIRFVCHIFPLEAALEPKYGVLSRDSNTVADIA